MTHFTTRHIRAITLSLYDADQMDVVMDTINPIRNIPAETAWGVFNV